MKDSLSGLLGIDTDNVEVEIDDEGNASYSVTVDHGDSMITKLNEDSFVNDLNQELQSQNPDHFGKIIMMSFTNYLSQYVKYCHFIYFWRVKKADYHKYFQKANKYSKIANYLESR